VRIRDHCEPGEASLYPPRSRLSSLPNSVMVTFILFGAFPYEHHANRADYYTRHAKEERVNVRVSKGYQREGLHPWIPAFAGMERGGHGTPCQGITGRDAYANSFQRSAIRLPHIPRVVGFREKEAAPTLLLQFTRTNVGVTSSVPLTVP
jgi:hypothetical protein